MLGKRITDLIHTIRETLTFAGKAAEARHERITSELYEEVSAVKEWAEDTLSDWEGATDTGSESL